MNKSARTLTHEPQTTNLDYSKSLDIFAANRATVPALNNKFAIFF